MPSAVTADKSFYSSLACLGDMAKDDLEDLHPEDRIKKLKKLEEEKKKEIEEARKKIRETQVELKEKRELKEKVPIREVAKEDLDGLSEEAKVILKELKGMKQKKGKSTDDEEDSEKATIAMEIAGVDDSKYEVERVEEAAGIPPEMEAARAEYVAQLSQQPAHELVGEMYRIHEKVEEKGYINPEEMKNVEYITAAFEEKREAGQEGRYTLTEKLSKELATGMGMGETMREMYLSHREQEPKDKYKCR